MEKIDTKHAGYEFHELLQFPLKELNYKVLATVGGHLYFGYC